MLHVEGMASSSADSISQVKVDVMPWLPILSCEGAGVSRERLEVREVGVSLSGVMKPLSYISFSCCIAHTSIAL